MKLVSFLERICLVTQEIIIQKIKAIIPAKNATGISKVIKAPLNTSSINLKTTLILYSTKFLKSIIELIVFLNNQL